MSNELINRQYVGARYVPKIMGEWNKALQYEALSVVTYMGNSFTSKVPVPANIEINNTNYWINTGNYNAQVENYRNETAVVNDKITKVEKSINVISFENFGAVGDGVINDTNAIIDCLKYAKDNNKIVTSKNKTYLINADIIFDNVIANSLGIIKCTNDAKIYIQNSSNIRNFTIDNGQLIIDAYYSECSNFTIQNYDGTCIKFQNTTTTPENALGSTSVHEFLINNYNLHSKKAIGIECNFDDMKIQNGVIINCNTGIIYNGGNILLDNIHLWINGYVDFNSSIAFDIRRTGFRITNCTVDTYGNIFKMAGDYLIGTVNGLNIIHNTILKPNVNITFIDKKFCTLNGSITIDLTNCSKNGVTFTQFDTANCFINYINGSPSDGYRQNTFVSTKGGKVHGLINSYGKITFIQLDIKYPTPLSYGNSDTIDISTYIENYKLASSFYATSYYGNTSEELTVGLALVTVGGGQIKIEHHNETVKNIYEVHIDIPILMY